MAASKSMVMEIQSSRGRKSIHQIFASKPGCRRSPMMFRSVKAPRKNATARPHEATTVKGRSCNISRQVYFADECEFRLFVLVSLIAIIRSLLEKTFSDDFEGTEFVGRQLEGDSGFRAVNG